MPTINALLDQLKTPIAILFDKINVKNNTQLNYLDFDLSAPEPVQIYGSIANTKVKITPKITSSFYKTQDIFYQRLNLADILSGLVGEIIPGNAQTLYDLMPQINIVFGINLLSEDIYNVQAPVYDNTSIPGTVRITVKAKPTSFLFFGTYELLLGPSIQDTTVAPFNVTYYIHTKGYLVAEYAKMLVSINGDGTSNTNFSFLRNATSVDTVVIDKVIQKNTGQLVLNGTFVVTVRLGADITPSVVSCSSLTLRLDGSIESTNSTPLFSNNPDIKYYENTAVNYKYIIDANNAIGRYTEDGVLDNTYSATGVSYAPTLLSVCPDGKVYCVSPVFTAPLSFNNNVSSKQIRVDRLNSNGTIDTTFNTVTISANGSVDPLPVASIVQLNNNGFWMLLQPLYGVSSTSISPVVNGIASVSGNSTNVYSWNPIFRVSQSGIVSQTFSKELKSYLDTSVFEFQGSNLAVGDKSIIADELSVTFFTQKANPITGYSFRQPLVFDTQAKINYLSGGEYEDLYRWILAKEIIAEPDGAFVSYGKLAIKLMDGSYGPVNYCIAKYKKTGAVDKLIYSQPLTTSQGTPLTLANVIFYKL